VDANYGAIYTIQLISFPLFPHENNLFKNDGNPKLSSFTCDTSSAVSSSSGAVISCVLSDITTVSIPGYILITLLLSINAI
jgi:hypothetical protein